MINITLLVGLPGSGKSTLGIEIVRKQNNALFLDDLSMLTGDAKSYLQSLDIKNLNELVISDIHFCKPVVRQKAILLLKEIFKDSVITEIFFENDPVQCKVNVISRMKQGDTRLVFEMILGLTKQYEIPAGVSPRSVKY